MSNLLKFFYLLPILFLSNPVYAQEAPPRFQGGLLTNAVGGLLSYIFPLIGFICLIFVIRGGYLWITSGGNPENLRKAKGTLTWSIVGLLLSMVIFGILTIIVNFLY